MVDGRKRRDRGSSRRGPGDDVEGYVLVCAKVRRKEVSQLGLMLVVVDPKLETPKKWMAEFGCGQG